MVGLLGLSLACSEYNLDADNTKNLGMDDVDTSSLNLDTGTPNDTGSTDTPDRAIVETGTEPSTEPVEEGGLEEPTLETDVGYNPDADLTSNLGNVVTILMALSEQWIPEETAKQLINSVEFTTDVAAPNILVIRDDNTNGEDEQDPVNITTWLQSVGYSVTFMDEPSNGISPSDSVVTTWLSFPIRLSTR